MKNGFNNYQNTSEEALQNLLVEKQGRERLIEELRIKSDSLGGSIQQEENAYRKYEEDLVAGYLRLVKEEAKIKKGT